MGFPKTGDKLVFMNNKGSQFDRDEAVSFGLIEGNVYTVASIEHGGTIDWVRFEERRGGACGFNLLMFQNFDSTESTQADKEV